MEPVWIKSYPEGVPAEVDVDSVGSICQLFDESVERYRDRPAFENLGARLSFDDVDRLSRAFAAYCQQRLGLEKGDRIAIMMPNLLQYPIALFGALRAGLTVVNTNPLYTPRELEHQLRDSGARAIVVLENFAHVVAECVDNTSVEHCVVARVGDLLPFPKSLLVNFVVKHVKKGVPPYHLDGIHRFPDCLDAGESLKFTPVEVGPRDLAFLQYTGGTTGVAKGAMLTHRNMVANVLQSLAWIEPKMRHGEELIITALPLYHIFALTANCLTYFKIGSLNYLITNPRDIPAFIKSLRSVRFTAITGVNTLYNALMNAPDFDKIDFSSLSVSLGGGMAVQRAVAQRWHAATGVPLLEAYGLTETSPAVCINPLDLEEYNGSVGLPVPSTECKVVDDVGTELGVGEAGELCVHGPQVMLGYWNRADETAMVLDADGWLRTGDIATIDERGYVRIVDRKKDMILVSGFNVYPNEVEDVVATHPGVLEVGAIGIPDPDSGEVVKLVVVKRTPDVTEESILALCREQLTGYKRPKAIEFVTELPKTNVGKILRRELRELYGR